MAKQNAGLPNGQTKQDSLDLSPADGAEGYIGAETGPVLGIDVVSGKKGSVESRPIWSEQSTGADQDTAVPDHDNPGTDSTDEFASYKHIRTGEGLPQTYRTSKGAGDAGPADPAEASATELNTQSVPSDDAGEHAIDMPQTEFTHNDGGGAPVFKHRS